MRIRVQGEHRAGPRCIGWLPTELLEVIIDLTEGLEVEGCWPGGISKSLVHLIPRALGGRRHIGGARNLRANMGSSSEADRMAVAPGDREAVQLGSDGEISGNGGGGGSRSRTRQLGVVDIVGR